MHNQLTFNFKTDISKISIPSKLNNPFGADIPEIAKIAAKEFQEFLALESQGWDYDFYIRRGKMFGILVIQQGDTYSYLGTISGKIPNNEKCIRFVPSVFDDSAEDCFINTGMTELTEIGKTIKKTENQEEVNSLIEYRRHKSIALQQQLFENYIFQNIEGKEKNVLQIFANSPPSAAGECAAPKLLNYAFKHQLKPIALAEFWWGQAENSEKEHKRFYPACIDRCRPILEYMLDDTELFKITTL